MQNLSKKSFLFVMLILVFLCKFYSNGVGFQINFDIPLTIQNQNFINNFGVSGSIKSDRLPFVFNSGFLLKSNNDENHLINGIGFFASLDYWLFFKQINNGLNFYAGIGIYERFSSQKKHSVNFLISQRNFIGINLLKLDYFIEIFLQQNICPSIELSKNRTTFLFEFPLETGIRFHF